MYNNDSIKKIRTLGMLTHGLLEAVCWQIRSIDEWIIKENLSELQKIYDEQIIFSHYVQLLSDNRNNNDMRYGIFPRIFRDIFTIAVFSERVQHLSEWIRTTDLITIATKESIIRSIHVELDNHASIYRHYRNSFDKSFIDFQLEMLQVINSLGLNKIKLKDVWFINKDINSLQDLIDIFNHTNFPRYDVHGYPLTKFLSSPPLMRHGIYKYISISYDTVQTINSMSLISEDVLNKMSVDDIDSLFLLKDGYNISHINLSANTLKKFTSETLDRYLQRIVLEDASFYYISSSFLDNIPSEVFTDELVKKYFSYFYSRQPNHFIEGFLQNKYNLKTMLKILEECV